jgi:hypothetical protein
MSGLWLQVTYYKSTTSRSIITRVDDLSNSKISKAKERFFDTAYETTPMKI